MTEKATTPTGEGDVIRVRADMLITELEVKSVGDLSFLLRAKADNLRNSFLETAMAEIHSKGWA